MPVAVREEDHRALAVDALRQEDDRRLAAEFGVVDFLAVHGVGAIGAVAAGDGRYRVAVAVGLVLVAAAEEEPGPGLRRGSQEQGDQKAAGDAAQGCGARESGALVHGEGSLKVADGMVASLRTCSAMDRPARTRVPRVPADGAAAARSCKEAKS